MLNNHQTSLDSKGLLALLPTGARTIAFVGTAKNTGKTTTLQAVVRALHENSERIGLLSVGIDGEAHDSVSGRDKPSIQVSHDTLVATASLAMRQASAALEPVETTDAHTPLGVLTIASATRAGEVVLAGVRHRQDVQKVRDRLFALGAQRVLIDGAFDRLAAADPDTADAIILSTGMALAPTLEAVQQITAYWIQMLTLAVFEGEPPWTDAHGQHSRSLFVQRSPDGPWESRGDSALLQKPWEGLRNLAGLMAPGLVSDEVMVQASRALQPGGRLIVRDPTRLLAQQRFVRTFCQRFSLEVLRRTPVAAIAVNPWSENATPVSTAQLQEAIRAVAGSIPVVDVRDIRA